MRAILLYLPREDISWDMLRINAIRRNHSIMQKKSSVWAWILVIVVIVIAVGARFAGKLVGDARHTFRTERYLMVDNGNLVFHKQTWGSTPERSIIKKLKSPTLTARTTGSQIEIFKDGKAFRHSGPAENIIVSSKNRAVFFTHYENDPSSKSNPQSVYPRLYMWTEKGGFETLNPQFVGTSSPQISADEQALLEQNYGAPGHEGMEVYDIKTKITTPIKNKDFYSAAIVDADTALTIVKDPSSYDDAYGKLFRIDQKTGNKTPILPDQLFGRITMFDGAIWALVKSNDSYQVVRIAPTLNRIEETINVK